MATLNLTTTEDTEAASNTTKGKRAGNPGTITSPALNSPGEHSSGTDIYCCAARFTGVTIPNGATISSAQYSMHANATYASGGTIEYIVCCQAADNAGALVASGSTDLDPGTRPGTTADSGVWNQNSISTSGGPNSDGRYYVTVTAAVQEVVNRAGWASGNAIVVITDCHTTTTNGEWQDYDANSATIGPKLDITYGAASLVRANQDITRQAVNRAATY